MGLFLIHLNFRNDVKATPNPRGGRLTARMQIRAVPFYRKPLFDCWTFNPILFVMYLFVLFYFLFYVIN
jgi:hypothetical protein